MNQSTAVDRMLGAFVFGFGLSLLASPVLLAELLGSASDATQAFTDFYASTPNRIRGVVCAVLLCVTPIQVAVIAAILRTGRNAAPIDRAVFTNMALLCTVGLFVAGGLLLATPALLLLGEVTGGPGIEPAGGAAVAKAGSIMLFAAYLPLSAWTSMMALDMRRANRIPQWFQVAGIVAAVLCLLAVIVVAMIPVAVWWIALGAWLQRAPIVSTAGP